MSAACCNYFYHDFHHGVQADDFWRTMPVTGLGQQIDALAGGIALSGRRPYFGWLSCQLPPGARRRRRFPPRKRTRSWQRQRPHRGHFRTGAIEAGRRRGPNNVMRFGK
jgi:hypothetical protein